MKNTFFFLVCLMLDLGSGNGYGQEIISSKSPVAKLSLTPTLERGKLPPNLFADISFEDANRNNILEANEKSILTISIRNEGNGPAQGVTVSALPVNRIKDKALKIGSGQTIPFLMPGDTVNIEIPMEAAMEIQTREDSIQIFVKERWGFDIDPPGLVIINTFKFQEPKLVFAGLDVDDFSPGTQAIQKDGKLQLGEAVKVKITIQNIGQNIAFNTRYKVTSTDTLIYLDYAEGFLGDLDIGEVRDFWITVTPAKRVKVNGDLPLFISLYNQIHRGELYGEKLPLRLDQRPAEPVVVNVPPDINKLYKEVIRVESPSNRMKASTANLIKVDVVPTAKTERTNAIAIVIGVENYDHFPKAPYAENDADLMAKYMKNVLGITDVRIFKSDQVKGYFYKGEFNPSWGDLQKDIIKGKTDLFVFYSGHGIPSSDWSRIYLLSSDTRQQIVEEQGFDLNLFYKDLLALGARNTTVLLDACFSGFTRASRSIQSESLVPLKSVKVKPPDVEMPWLDCPTFSVFTSSEYDQVSLGFDDARNGLFTYWICAGLQGAADLNHDNQITLGELSAYVTQNVQEHSRNIWGIQTPQFNGNADLVIAVY